MSGDVSRVFETNISNAFNWSVTSTSLPDFGFCKPQVIANRSGYYGFKDFTRVFYIKKSPTLVIAIQLIGCEPESRMLPTPREFCRHILSERTDQAASNKRRLHLVSGGISL